MRLFFNVLLVVFLQFNAHAQFSSQSEQKNKIDSLLIVARKEVSNNKKVVSDVLQKAELLAKKLNDPNLNAEILYRYGVSNYIWGKYDIAYQKNNSALQLFEQENNLKGIAKCNTTLGLIYIGIGRYASAIETFNKSIKLYNEINKSNANCSNYLNIGIAKLELKQFSESNDSFKMALKLSRLDNRIDVEHMALNRIGEVFLNQKKYDSAFFYFNAVLNHKVIPSNWEKSYSYNMMAKCHLDLKQYDKALKYANEAFKLNEEINADWDMSLITNTLHQIYISKGDSKKAYHYLLLHNKYKDNVTNESDINKINLMEIHQKESEKNKLIFDKQIAEKQLIQSRLVNSAFGILLIIFSSAVFLLIRNNRLKKNYNSRLQKINRDIRTKKIFIESQNKALSELNKSKITMLSVLSHDIKAPLNSISAVLNMYNEGGLKGEEKDMLLNHLGSEVEKTKNWLENMLVWIGSQLEKTSLNPVSLNIIELVNETVDSFNLIKEEKNIEISHFIPDREVLITADLNQIRSILHNIISNSIKFTREKGTVDINYSFTQNQVKLHIKDNGVGMSLSKIKEILTLNRQIISSNGTFDEKGTGLGLLLVKQFLIYNKGTLDIVSEENKGTEFIISFIKS